MKARLSVVVAALLYANSSWAQPDATSPPSSPPPAKTEEPPKAKSESVTWPYMAPSDTLRLPTHELMKQRPGLAPWDRETGWFHESYNGLSFSGGLETDIGYAKYTHDATTFNPEDFYDFRGRFVLGPILRYEFPNSSFFFRATGQFVGWLREQYGIYQVNVDDVYGQVGQYGVWDLQAGRFMTWRVYRKGLGYDLYTLEDTGALKNQAVESGEFYAHTYEVNYIFYREQPGRLAFHLYPTDWSGLELMGVYGKDGTSNTAGGRAAGNAHFGIVSLSAAAEYRYSRPAIYAGTYDANNVFQSCDKCGLVKHYGFGGGAVVTFKPIELGFNAAQGYYQSWALKDGTPDKASSGVIKSFGGYLEVDVGSLAFHRGLILGAGYNKTSPLNDDGGLENHTQSVAYVAFPLGFNNAMIKLVLSKSDGHQETPAGVAADGHPLFVAHNDTMTSARFRLSFNF
jgi:hypothetical protein